MTALYSNGDYTHGARAPQVHKKDFITRVRGYYTPYIPGWDNHGMPIPRHYKGAKLNHKAMSVADFRSACRRMRRNISTARWTGSSVWVSFADWEHP